MKILTVVVPCYNSEAYMNKCLKTVISAGEDVEVIIVDDGSTDDTKEKVNKFINRTKALDQKILYLNFSNTLLGRILYIVVFSCNSVEKEFIYCFWFQRLSTTNVKFHRFMA